MFKKISVILVLQVLLLSGCKKEEVQKRESKLKAQEKAIPVSTGISKITLSYSEWPPYCSSSLDGAGVSSQIIAEAFKKEGLKVELLKESSWSHAFNKTANGDFSGSIAWYKTKEREELFFFSDPIHRVETVFFHRKGMDFDWEKIVDLSSYRIDGTKVYEYGDRFQFAESEGFIKVHRNDSDLEGFKRLLSGEADLFTCSYEVGQRLLAKHFTDEERQKISFNPLPITSKSVYLILNRKDPKNLALVERFNNGLIKLRASGELSNYQQGLSTLPIIRIGTGECAPYSGINLASGGFSTEYVEQLMTLAGYCAKTDFYPWKRCEELLQRGGVDLIFPYVKTPKREEKYLFSNPMATTTGSFYINRKHLQNLPEVKGIEDLRKLKDFNIVGLRGYYMNEDLEKSGLEIKKVNYVGQAIKLLETGRYDIAVLMDSEYYVMLQEKENEYLEDIIKVIEAPWWTQKMGIMVSKDNSEGKALIEKINKALKVAEERKYLDQIMAEQGIPHSLK